VERRRAYGLPLRPWPRDCRPRRQGRPRRHQIQARRPGCRWLHGGAPEKPLSVAVFGLIFGRRSFSGSPIGGLAETQEMLDFCGKQNITADVEVIPIQKINEAYDRLAKSDVKYRFSIDMASLKSE
jgi:D-arabinose 1-dehydrogenase-like Zn-dependent alcohol dehydrogenase